MAVVFFRPRVASHLVTAVLLHSGSRTISSLILLWLRRCLETIRWFQKPVRGQVNPNFSLYSHFFEASSDAKGEVRLLPVCGSYLYGPQQWNRDCVRWLPLCLSCHRKSVVIFLIKCHYSVAQKWEQWHDFGSVPVQIQQSQQSASTVVEARLFLCHIQSQLRICINMSSLHIIDSLRPLTEM